MRPLHLGGKVIVVRRKGWWGWDPVGDRMGSPVQNECSCSIGIDSARNQFRLNRSNHFAQGDHFRAMTRKRLTLRLPVQNDYSCSIGIDFARNQFRLNRSSHFAQGSPTGPQPGPIPTSLFAELLLLSLPDGRAAHLGGRGDFSWELLKSLKYGKFHFGGKN